MEADMTTLSLFAASLGILAIYAFAVRAIFRPGRNLRHARLRVRQRSGRHD